MRKVATFWKEETKYLSRYLPTSGFARAFTRSASALFQVKAGSSKSPETCKTTTSFSSFSALRAAALGECSKWMLVPNSPVQTASSGPVNLGPPAQLGAAVRARNPASIIARRMADPPFRNVIGACPTIRRCRRQFRFPDSDWQPKAEFGTDL